MCAKQSPCDTRLKRLVDLHSKSEPEIFMKAPPHQNWLPSSRTRRHLLSDFIIDIINLISETAIKSPSNGHFGAADYHGASPDAASQ